MPAAVRRNAQMKSLTRKEARKQLEFLLAMEKLAGVLDKPQKRPRAQAAGKRLRPVSF